MCLFSEARNTRYSADYLLFVSEETKIRFVLSLESAPHPVPPGTIFLDLMNREGRVLNFSPVVGIGTPPTPHPQARMPSPPWFRGKGGEGVGESQFRRWDIRCGVLCIYILCDLMATFLHPLLVYLLSVWQV